MAFTKFQSNLARFMLISNQLKRKERASMISELLGLSEIGISRSDDSFISKDSLLISILESLLLNILLQCKERAKLLFDCIGDSVHFDLLLATRARHEGKGDSK